MSELETLGACPSCQSPDLEELFPEERLQRCRPCGLLFHNPRPTAAAIARFYSQEGKYAHWFSESAGRRKMWQRRLSILERFLPRGSLLDVGAGIGSFLALARETGRYQVQGTEISEEGVRLAAEHRGIELLPGPLDEQRLPENSLDGITLFHVLEHVPFPGRTLAHCVRLLRPGGKLLVAVPNDSALHRFKEHHRGWAALARVLDGSLGDGDYLEAPPFPRLDLDQAPPDAEIHLTHFHRASLRKAFELQGLRVLHQGQDPAYPTSGLARWRDDAKFVFWRGLQALLGPSLYGTMLTVGEKPPE